MRINKLEPEHVYLGDVKINKGYAIPTMHLFAVNLRYFDTDEVSFYLGKWRLFLEDGTEFSPGESYDTLTEAKNAAWLYLIK